MTSEDILKTIKVAANAPSSHNTQPWKIRLIENGLVIGYDPSRQLLVGDPQKRELFISLGTYIESLALAAADLGYDANISFQGVESDEVAKIDFNISKSLESLPWSQLITERRSDRRLYSEHSLDPKIITELQKISYDDASLKIFADRADINFLSDMTCQATKKIMETEVFRKELSSWVRNNWTRKNDGMPGYTQGMPGLISLLAKFIIKKNKKVAISQAKKDQQRIQCSAAIGLIIVPNNTPYKWLSAGQLFQKVCLAALRQNIKTSPISAAIIDPETVKKITTRFRLVGYPVALIRFGYKPGSVKSTPRLNPIDVILKD